MGKFLNLPNIKTQLQLGCVQRAKWEILAKCSWNVLQQLIQYLILMFPDIIKCIQNMPNISRYILSKFTSFI